MADFHQQRPAPGWFWALALLALLFEAFGIYAYLTDVTRSAEDLASLPVDQRALREATPGWIFAAYAIAVWSGLAGAVLLLMRRRHAVPLLLLSLIAVVVQFGGTLLLSDLRGAMPPVAFTLPIAIALVAYGIWHFARSARRHGWLR